MLQRDRDMLKIIAMGCPQLESLVIRYLEPGKENIDKLSVIALAVELAFNFGPSR